MVLSFLEVHVFSFKTAPLIKLHGQFFYSNSLQAKPVDPFQPQISNHIVRLI
jgi:hypothetical protein